ncbi:Gfo/Idh/MocA family protein [Yeguia hominis]|mgnify:FL=1|uniref:Gfo/Idh/MocA family oxidoreductase n=1 Tax=Yeguia hominis TaxID=2763662 RepID=A0A926DDE8_9FIRM|nr:Gfo/Idh/MocA family oxidoreductase [Yeguia hominis]MBC8534975.1 Gfo/Idh/MocA family oxidoreductase [Yeguia hominis]
MINVGIAGCGSIARFRHAPEYLANPESKIAGFYDPISERSEALSREFGGCVYASYDDMLKDPNISAISVCSANTFHAQMTIQALQAGKHVLCEKPLATSSKDAEKMVEAAKSSGCYLMVGQNQRFHPAHKKAKEILKVGELGKVLSFRTGFAHAGPETWSADKSNKTWFFDKSKAFIGAMGDLGVHKLDLVQWLIGEPITEVMALVTTIDKRDSSGDLISVDDNARCILKMPSGIIGTLSVSWTCYGEEENGTTIYCEKGVMKIFEDPDYSITVTSRNGDKTFYQLGKIQTNESQSNSGVIDAFIESIIKQRPPEISGEEGLKTLRVIEACLYSSQIKQSVLVR